MSPQFQQTELGGRQAPRTPQDKDRVARTLGKAPRIIKIEPSADRAIDRLVYELPHEGMIYGLTEEEIRIVEEK